MASEIEYYTKKKTPKMDDKTPVTQFYTAFVIALQTN